MARCSSLRKRGILTHEQRLFRGDEGIPCNGLFARITNNNRNPMSDNELAKQDICDELEAITRRLRLIASNTKALTVDRYAAALLCNAAESTASALTSLSGNE